MNANAIPVATSIGRLTPECCGDTVSGSSSNRSAFRPHEVDALPACGQTRSPDTVTSEGPNQFGGELHGNGSNNGYFKRVTTISCVLLQMGFVSRLHAARVAGW
jgi:hypothetical protein